MTSEFWRIRATEDKDEQLYYNMKLMNFGPKLMQASTKMGLTSEKFHRKGKKCIISKSLSLDNTTKDKI